MSELRIHWCGSLCCECAVSPLLGRLLILAGKLDQSVRFDLYHSHPILYLLTFSSLTLSLTPPVANVFLPKDRISMNHQGFGFCEFMSEQDAEYAVKIMNQIKLYGKPIRVNKASYDKKQLDVGANLFIGNLDENVDENALYDTFATFGAIAEHPKVS
jgi:RNA recognition motif-containing protein